MRLIENCTVLVVEDETPIRNNLVRKLGDLDLPLRVIGTASNGQEAIALIEEKQPQIVITDIRMPGMDGLALCKYLYENHPSVKIVVLSGYGEFEYAQAAIRYAVSDYFLKPLNTQKLFETMEKLCDEIDQSRRASQRQCLARQLSGNGLTEEFPYQFEQGSFGLYLICLGNLLDHARSADRTRYQALWEKAALDPFLEQEALDCWWTIEERNPNERMLLIAGRAPQLAAKLYRRLTDQLAGICSVNLCEAGREVGFSEIWSVARRMREHLRQSLVPCQNGLFPLSAAPERAGIPKTFRQAAEAAIRSRSMGSLKSIVHAALQEFRTAGITQSLLEHTIQERLSLLMERRPNGPGTVRQVSAACCQEIAMATDSAALYQSLERLLTEAVDMLESAVPADGLAAAVKAHIDAHYQEEITMEGLAEQFHFSESYIARLFRTQYGAPPVKYLLYRRIERAKELIVENEALSFGTIAELVGYGDQHYFSRLFRISTGMSPSEYRASVLASRPGRDKVTSSKQEKEGL